MSAVSEDRDAAKLSRKDSVTVLDDDNDGRVSRHEAIDLDDDGRVSRHEKDLVDRNDDGKLTRQEVLSTPDVDINRDGKITKHEVNTMAKEAVTGHSTAWPVLHSQHPSPPPIQSILHIPRHHWKYGWWDYPQDAVDEVVLLAVFFVSLHAAVRWIVRRLARQRYQPINRDGEDVSLSNPSLELRAAPDSTSRSHVSAHGALDESQNTDRAPLSVTTAPTNVPRAVVS